MQTTLHKQSRKKRSNVLGHDLKTQLELHAMLLPGALSIIVFSIIPLFGLIIAFNRKPMILVGTSAIMIISYVIRKLPYTVRSGTAFLYQMDPFVEEASINLGVSPLKTFFTVTARMMLPGVMSGAVLSWITCINELSSSIMLYSGKTSTIAIAIYQEVTHMNDGPASALATILTVTTIISLLIVFRATKGKVKIV